MDEENRGSFGDFKEKISATPIKTSDKSLDEIESEMDAIIKAYESEAKT